MFDIGAQILAQISDGAVVAPSQFVDNVVGINGSSSGSELLEHVIGRAYTEIARLLDI